VVVAVSWLRARRHVHTPSIASALAVLTALMWSSTACDATEARREPAPRGQPSRLRIVVVTDLQGELEPCGCGDRPAGGVDRLVEAIGALAREPSPTVVFAFGESYRAGSSPAHAASRAGPRAWSAELMQQVLARLGAHALGPGFSRHEVQVGAQRVVVVEGAQVGVQAGEFTIGVVAGGVDVSALADDPRAAELIVHAADDASAYVAQRGASVVVSPGRHAEGFVVVDVWLASETRGLRLDSERARVRTRERRAVARYVPLTAELPRDRATRARLDALFARINRHNEQLARQAARERIVDDGLAYVGSETCAACHTAAYFWWRGTAHARAFDSLVMRGRELDLDCVGCHVTGAASSAAELVDIQARRGVGCESCHGPGGKHADNPRAVGLGALTRAVPTSRCTRCHDREHGRSFVERERRGSLIAVGHGLTAPPPRPALPASRDARVVRGAAAAEHEQRQAGGEHQRAEQQQQ
jgi:Cytochrome c554 and c-prime